MFLRPILLPLSLAGLFAAGCRTYEPAPIDWAGELRAWEGRTATNVVTLTLAEAREAALIGNPEINAFRLRHAASRRVAEAVGWWEDPQLNVDVLKVLRDGANPMAWSSSLAVTIPLSGVPGLEARAAAGYAEADAWAVRAEERALVARVDAAIRSAVGLADLSGRLASGLGAPDYTNALAAASRLAAAGELSAVEAARLAADHRLLVNEQADLAREAAAAARTATRLLGFAPGVRCVWKEVPPPSAPSVPDALALAGHPAVRTALARFGGTEAALKAEIRRQYPELTVGPAYERDDGFNRVGVAAGLTLPLWNRNRRAIAEAGAARDAARAEALAVWRRLVADAAENAAARAGLADAIGNRGESGATATAARLYRVGELDAAGFAAQAQAAFTAELARGRRWLEYARLVAEAGRFNMTEEERKEVAQ